jgi:selenoprotein W-related protein
MVELLKTHEREIERIALFPSDGGVFEVVVNGELIYSKKHTGRHANPGEVKALLQKFLEERSI